MHVFAFACAAAVVATTVLVLFFLCFRPKRASCARAHRLKRCFLVAVSMRPHARALTVIRRSDE